MEQRYIANNLPAQTLASPSLVLLKASLEDVIRLTPPLQSYTSDRSGGLFSGYTGLAYLFLRLSVSHSDMDILGHSLRFWAARYLDGERDNMVIMDGNCGLACEKLSYQAVRACLSGKSDDIIQFLANIPLLLGPYPPSTGDPFGSELIYGRAGALYMLRMIRSWHPNCALIMESPIDRLTDLIMHTDEHGRDNWEWHGKRYFGAAHGEMGIVTQLVLSKPELAPDLEHRLSKLLDLQWSDGNWPSSERKLKQGQHPKLVQWCHGASGFIFALQAMRPYFPKHSGNIDQAIAKAQDLVWRHGLLTKEPSLCHGIFGNALALPRGPLREHFLSLATVEAVQRVRQHDSKLFASACYDKEWSMLMSYHSSAAWAWSSMDEDNPSFILFTNV